VRGYEKRDGNAGKHHPEKGTAVGTGAGEGAWAEKTTVRTTTRGGGGVFALATPLSIRSNTTIWNTGGSLSWLTRRERKDGIGKTASC